MPKKKSHVLGHIYKRLLQYDTKMEQVKLCMVKWMQNFGEEIPFQQWEKLWIKVIKSIASQALRDNWYNMEVGGCWYITPKYVVKMDGNYKGMCLKCKEIDGAFYHMLWSFGKTNSFWKTVQVEIQKS